MFLDAPLLELLEVINRREWYEYDYIEKKIGREFSRRKIDTVIGSRLSFLKLSYVSNNNLCV